MALHRNGMFRCRALLFQIFLEQFTLCNFMEYARIRNYIVVHGCRSGTTVRCHGIAKCIGRHTQRASRTIYVTLPTILACLRISQNRFAFLFIKIEHVHGTNLYALSAANAFIQINSNHTHCLAPPPHAPRGFSSTIKPFASGSPGK